MMDTRENLLRVIRHDHPAWVPREMEGFTRVYPPVVERPTTTGPDAFGVRWVFVPEAEGGTYPLPGGHTIHNLAAWREQLTFPNVDAMDWQSVTAQVAAIDRTRCLVEGFVEMGLFERSYLLLGMEEALMAYVQEPDLMAALLNALADYKIALIERFHAAARLDILWYGDDWGTQRQLFLPPKIWRRVVRPATQRIYDCAHRLGILVNQHSCGKIEDVFPDMVEMGADMWNPCQPCNDLARLKAGYGDRITFYGGIDSQFVLARPGATPGEVRAEVRRRIDEMAAGGGYVAAPSHSVPYDPALLHAMNEEIETYGHTYYQG
jgi:hypothetical protein